MKRSLFAILVLLPLIPAPAQNMILPLWEGNPPNYRETGEVTIWDTSDIVRIRNVQLPDIAVFLPSRKNSTGRAVVICPGDDRAVPVENSLAYYRALQELGIPAELHIYPYGGHGYSLAIGQGHLSSWPGRVADWISYIFR